jgi:serine protein kinase
MTTTSVSNIANMSQQLQKVYRDRNTILSFDAYLELVRKSPRTLLRNSAEYLRDCFDYFGQEDQSQGKSDLLSHRRFKLFDLGTERSVPIVGGQRVQNQIYRSLQAFVAQGVANKVIFLHGPNGSAKSSTIEAISHGMQRYSESDAGAVYRFNWIFPVERGATPRTVSGDSGPIGFSPRRDESSASLESYAYLDDHQIISKLQSEFKENPIFLLPMPFREKVIREWLAAASGQSPESIKVPPHLLLSGLSKKNQLIFDNLMVAYDGDVQKVFRHIQVERFVYNRQYRIGIATVEPQMSMDAQEKQLTMDKNIQNLPAVLHNIRFTEAMGELVEANRGILEFSDLLKRPTEAFKYLLTTVERGTLGLSTATQNIDVVFFATANEKHLDAFKSTPDFSSFNGRFDLVTVPYILTASDEAKIYARDIETIGRHKFVAPHSLDMLCLWAVMTRLKHPDAEYYDAGLRGLVNRLDPFGKALLYDNRALDESYSPADQILLKQVRHKIMNESVGSVIYEGRFGASPRETRALLYRIADDASVKVITPMSIFAELERLVKDRSVYDFLQFEPRNKYHDVAFFIKNIRDYFAQVFESELLLAMTLVEEKQYDHLLTRYIENAVATVKKEKIFNRKTESHEAPSEILMRDVESILGVSGDPARFRESLLARIASYKIDNPTASIDFALIFSDHLARLREHYYAEQSKVVENNLKAMLALGHDIEREFKEKDLATARETYKNLALKYGYNDESSRDCVRFLLANGRR